MDADPLADTDPEITCGGEPVRLYRAPLTVGDVRRALLAFADSEVLEVEALTPTGRAEFCGWKVQRWVMVLSGERQRATPRLLVRPADEFAAAPYDPEAEYVRLELAVEGS